MQEDLKKTIPEIGDFSRKSTNKAVLKGSLEHNLTLWPLAVGSLGVLASVLISTLYLPVAVAGLGIGSTAFIVNFCFRNEFLANQYIDKLRRQIEEHEKLLLVNIENQLSSYKFKKGAIGKYAEQAAEQFIKIQQKFQNLRDLLLEKLSAAEITFNRYLGTAEQVYLSVLDNLKEISILLKNIEAADSDYMRCHLDELRKQISSSDIDKKEIKTLEERLDLINSQMSRIDLLLTKNEEAMTAIDKTTAAIVEMKTNKAMATMDFESARRELENLAKRAKEYSS